MSLCALIAGSGVAERVCTVLGEARKVRLGLGVDSGPPGPRPRRTGPKASMTIPGFSPTGCALASENSGAHDALRLKEVAFVSKSSNSFPVLSRRGGGGPIRRRLPRFAGQHRAEFGKRMCNESDIERMYAAVSMLERDWRPLLDQALAFSPPPPAGAALAYVGAAFSIGIDFVYEVAGPGG